MYRNMYKFLFFVVLLVTISIVSCKKYLPDDRDSIAQDVMFTQTIFSPVLGRYTLMNNNFYAGTSTIPLTFKIINPRVYNDGSVATILTDTFPVKVWDSLYSGNETTLEEIERKRKIEYHPVFEVREHSGDFVMYPTARSPYVLSQQDSGYLFDIEASNSGGRLYFRDLALRPFKERSFEPSNLNAYTGQASLDFVYPTTVVNVDGSKAGTSIGLAARIYFNKKNSTGHTLTFRFQDTLLQPINPLKFGDTDWKHLVHGFNMKMTDSTVTYDVAYPIPLAPLPTQYTTTDGTRARIDLKYHRLAFGNVRKDALIHFEFAIYEEGDWEIIFRFPYDNPKFDND